MPNLPKKTSSCPLTAPLLSLTDPPPSTSHKKCTLSTKNTLPKIGIPNARTTTASSAVSRCGPATHPPTRSAAWRPIKCWDALGLPYGECDHGRFNFTNDSDNDHYCATPDGIVQELREVAPAIARIRPLPLRLGLTGVQAAAVTAPDLEPMRHLITWFWSVECVDDRITHKLNEYDLYNTLAHWVGDCKDLDVRREDYQRSPLLRDIVFRRSIIRTLETNAFSDLPQLRMVSLEYGIFHPSGEWHQPETTVFTKPVRDYLFAVHCGCEFAWFRRWRSSAALVNGSEHDYCLTYKFKTAWGGVCFPVPDLYVPIDCARGMPTGAASVDLNQTAFSRNEGDCGPMTA
ncbi:uncharacterized protein LOC129588001 [Paramacrobiotus metropolitanus]|uniref:uncharacterized protein LOC129588001 n=1 Tax=Paramacrobiotus metropolitanus TaxID=2943436 RepID=UPI0024465B97|nr:uncharacterized protein LOC129588001 [Paramacrobiotus metropolitanus]